MIKTTILSQVLVVNEILGARVLAANETDNVERGHRLKLIKLKTGRSKSQKLTKYKKTSKSKNSPEFGNKKVRSNFLTPDSRTAINCLELAFIKAPILSHFDLEYYIWTEIDIFGYIIRRVLNQLTLETSLNKAFIKVDLGQ